MKWKFKAKISLCRQLSSCQKWFFHKSFFVSLQVQSSYFKSNSVFQEFEDKRDADDAVYELDRKEFFGSR